MKPDRSGILRLLGYAGLIPFIALPMLQTVGVVYTALPYSTLFDFYSVVILGFMAGVLWPARESDSAHQALAWLSVTPPVLGFLTLAIAPGLFLWVQLMLFLGLRGAEILLGFERHYAPYYRTLRWHLTLVVVACHGWMIGLQAL
ncbi:DUF3429 domain-containing protein [Salinispirillum marinum]|uniref:DUF3429 domain-containing protein n=2 Tax=Saccharospirillaceae TaxID=255527 RepID=A0ABV8BCD1_9GAMM